MVRWLVVCLSVCLLVYLFSVCVLVGVFVVVAVAAVVIVGVVAVAIAVVAVAVAAVVAAAVAIAAGVAQTVRTAFWLPHLAEGSRASQRQQQWKSYQIVHPVPLIWTSGWTATVAVFATGEY